MSSQLRAGGRWRPACLIACAWVAACKFDTSAPETFAVDGGGDAGHAHAAAGATASDDTRLAQAAATAPTTSPDAGAAATPAADGGSGGSIGTATNATTATTATKATTATTPNTSAPASTGQGGAPAIAPADVDAGLAPARDAAADPESSIDDTECAFEFSACLLANPLGYAECARTNAEHCDLLGASGMPTTAADGGVQPSAACSLQVADCIMRMPAQAQACMDMLATCTL